MCGYIYIYIRILCFHPLRRQTDAQKHLEMHLQSFNTVSNFCSISTTKANGCAKHLEVHLHLLSNCSASRPVRNPHCLSSSLQQTRYSLSDHPVINQLRVAKALKDPSISTWNSFKIPSMHTIFLTNSYLCPQAGGFRQPLALC